MIPKYDPNLIVNKIIQEENLPQNNILQGQLADILALSLQQQGASGQGKAKIYTQISMKKNYFLETFSNLNLEFTDEGEPKVFEKIAKEAKELFAKLNKKEDAPPKKDGDPSIELPTLTIEAAKKELESKRNEVIKNGNDLSSLDRKIITVKMSLWDVDRNINLAESAEKAPESDNPHVQTANQMMIYSKSSNLKKKKEIEEEMKRLEDERATLEESRKRLAKNISHIETTYPSILQEERMAERLEQLRLDQIRRAREHTQSLFNTHLNNQNYYY